jgi:ketosteroid isomerase-like protein
MRLDSDSTQSTHPRETDKLGIASDVAGKYLVALSRAQVEEVLSFFREDASLYWRDRDFVGKAQIQEFYQDRLQPTGVVFTDLSFIEDGLTSVVRATAAMANGRREEIVDVFTVDEVGSVLELRIFFRNYTGG